MSLFSGTLLTLPDIVIPNEQLTELGQTSNNIICLIVVIFMFVIYLILLLWAKYQDTKNVMKVITLV